MPREVRNIDIHGFCSRYRVGIRIRFSLRLYKVPFISSNTLVKYAIRFSSESLLFVSFLMYNQ